MCGVSRCDVREHGGHVALFTRLNVPCVERLISNRKLRWAGHVARMDIRDRLPRKLLLAWVKDVSRPRGRVFSYGHDLSRELKSIGFNLDDRAIRWQDLSSSAQSRPMDRLHHTDGGFSQLDRRGTTQGCMAWACGASAPHGGSETHLQSKLIGWRRDLFNSSRKGRDDRITPPITERHLV